MNNKILIIGVVVAILLGTVGLIIASTKTVKTFGGYTAGYWDSAGGYKVDGTAVIDGNGAFDIASGTAVTTLTASSTLVVSGATTLSSTLTVTGLTNLDSLIQGGATTTLSSAATTTAITAAQICANIYIDWAASGLSGDATMTLPSDTDLRVNCLKADGDSKEILFRNTSSGLLTKASSTWIVAGTDIDLMAATGTEAVGDRIIAGGEARLTFTRIAASTTIVELTELIDID